MTFNDVISTVLTDLDIKLGDSEVSNVKDFINRGYYELAKKENTSLPDAWKLVNTNDELLTNEKNKEFIVSFTKYLYFLYDDDYNKAELHKRDYENTRIVKSKKITHITYER